MAQIAKMESQVEIESSAEKFYQTFKNKPNQLPKMCPNVVKDVQLIKGDWESTGSIRKWIFVPAGNASSEFCTVLVEGTDDKNKTVTQKAMDGELIRNLYNSCKIIVQATDKANGCGSVVKTTVEYEKKNEAVPDPSKYFELAAILYKTMDAYLINNA